MSWRIYSLVLSACLIGTCSSERAPSRVTDDQDNGPVIFTDPELDRAVGLALPDGASPDDLHALGQITSLTSRQGSIGDLTGIDRLTGLRVLDLSENLISDLTPIQGLTNLVFLALELNHVSDVSPLQTLDSLSSLVLSHNRISDISPLLNMTGLAHVDVSGNPLSRAALDETLPALRDRGVEVTNLSFESHPGSILFSGDWLGSLDIYGMSADGSAMVRLTSAEADEGWPAISPDGRYVAYASNAGGDFDIYLLEAATGESLRLTAGTEDDYDPTWQPDGNRIAFTRSDSTASGVFVQAVDASDPTFVLAGREPSWSPQGELVVVIDAGEFSTPAIVDVSGAIHTTIETHGDAYQPAWSPDGTTIAFTVATALERRLGSSSLLHFDVLSGAVVAQEGLGSGGAWESAWSADGRILVYSAMESGSAELFSVPLYGDNPVQLTSLPGYVGSPAWSPMDIQTLAPWGSPLPTCNEQVVEIADLALESAVREALRLFADDAVSRCDAEKLTSLRANLSGVTSLEGLEVFTGLRTLQLMGNDLEDISPLANLPGLFDVWLADNRISDLSAAGTWRNLWALHLDRNDVGDVSVFSQGDFPTLRILELRENEIEDVSPLASVPTIRELKLNFNRIINVTPLAQITDLQKLNLTGNSVADLTPLLELQHLDSLYVLRNPLNATSIHDVIPQLRERGVGVRF